jgi:hypothetical protein
MADATESADLYKGNLQIYSTIYMSVDSIVVIT